jgi:formylglycine-generating enzyme required for sulfatase activity
MATPEPQLTAPKAFISYSWDDEEHKEWVKRLATRMRVEDGVDVTLDRWHSAPGDQIPAFMERAVRENDFVIAVCSPRFKERSDGRVGGAGYEGDIMTAYALTIGEEKKFIPILRRGSWREAAPTWLLGRAKIDLSGDPYSESEYKELVDTLRGEREAAPPIGVKKRSQASRSPGPGTPAGSSVPQRQSPVTPVAPDPKGHQDVDNPSAPTARPSLISQRIDGWPILDYVRHPRPLSVAERIKLIESGFRALQRLHSDSLLCGDISLNNVMVQPGDIVRIDRGRDGPPWRGESQAGWVDIRALAEVAFDVLTDTGQPPWTRPRDRRQALRAAGVPSEVVRVLLKALRDKDRRKETDPELYASAGAVADDLGDWRKRRVRKRMGVAVLLAALAILAWAGWSKYEPEIREALKVLATGDAAPQAPPVRRQPTIASKPDILKESPPVKPPVSSWQGVKPGELKTVQIRDREIHFHWCPPSKGKFQLGSPVGEKDRSADEGPVELEIPQGFWMQETEVTQALWEAVRKEMKEKLDWSGAKGPNLPVYNVSYDQAKIFAEELTKQLRDSRQLPNGWKISLPTEARWEYAARASSTTRFPFGEDEGKLREYAWYDGNSGGKPHEVRTREPNAWGLRDMLGNVWEWCANSYSDKLPHSVDPPDPPGASHRVIRGGSWGAPPGFCRPAFRYGCTPGSRSNGLGFRVAAVQE